MELSTLSWMLLAADRGDAVGGGSLIVIFLIFVGLLIRTFFLWMDNDGKPEGFQWMPTPVLYATIGFSVVAGVCSLVPSSTVIMQVAAIELGDDVLNSAEFQRILEIYIPKGE